MTNLIKRKKAERRFHLYGIFAVSLSLLFVLTLIINIFSNYLGMPGELKNQLIK